MRTSRHYCLLSPWLLISPAFTSGFITRSVRDPPGFGGQFANGDLIHAAIVHRILSSRIDFRRNNKDGSQDIFVHGDSD
ncbi:hypothetical protein SprV_0401417900 [Sparganum proliferum]